VLWWDPHELGLDKELAGGMRHRAILEADASGETPSASEKLHAEWRERRTRVLAAGATPSLVVHGVTEAARAWAEVGGPSRSGPHGVSVVVGGRHVTIEATDVERFARPSGKRFGALVHAVLATSPLDADAAAVRVLATSHARLLDATAAECDAAITAVVIALAHPLMRRAAAARELRREVPIVLRRDPGTVIEGIVDLAFADDAGWTVVDFKTDASTAQYEAQVVLYADAIGKATKLPCAAALLLV
jgi:hypothetical protein